MGWQGEVTEPFSGTIKVSWFVLAGCPNSLYFTDAILGCQKSVLSHVAC